MVSEEELETEGLAEKKPAISKGRVPAAVWIAAVFTMTALVTAWLKYSPQANAKPVSAAPVSVHRVVVSKPLIQNLDTRLSFLANSRPFRKSRSARR